MGIGIFCFLQQLVCCTFASYSCFRYGVVVFSQSHNYVKLLYLLLKLSEDFWYVASYTTVC